ncbi:hypothetical protein COCON_G00144400 [Conger conger]|uniref:Homeobox domain-containing protein n=1 Tax=Conger conger TaxID=82655 RepID=A0A9Q1HW16_CONCO|nr:hypothetical protein COCON_G00144400 [Conger conger]
MASKRKSTTPCMIPLKSMHVQEEVEPEGDPPDCLSHPGKDSSSLSGEETCEQGTQEVIDPSRPDGDNALEELGTYICRPCGFESQDLNLFLDHVYSGHADFRAEPSFHCVDCGVSTQKFEGLALHNARAHPSSAATTLQVRRRDRRLTVEQSLVFGEGSKESEISITKTPIMKMLKGKSELKRIVVSHTADEQSLDSVANKEAEKKDMPTVTHVPTIVHNGGPSKVTVPSAIQIVNSSGTLPVLKTGITQVVSMVQNRTIHQQAPISASTSTSTSNSRNLPKVMIPLSSIPTYNAAMDTNSFLKTSFSKFPYPTKAELCYLTVVTKYPEEQIKIWFTAQRLKQGISWSPEEIEDARRKMFNTIIQTAPPTPQQQRHSHHTSSQHTFTVLPASLGPSGIPQILQGSLMGQGGVIVTQPVMANGIQVSSAPVALAVTPKPQAATKPLMQARPAAALVADKGLSMVVGTNKKSQEQLSALKQSFIRCQFPGQEEVERLTKITGLTVREVRKWFSDRRYHYRNLKGSRSGVGGLFSGNSLLDLADSPSSSESPKANQSAQSPPRQQQQQMSPSTPTRRAPRQQTPDFTAIRYKERDPQQVRALEASFGQDPSPSEEEVGRLRAETKMTRREIDGWFSERRKKAAAEKKKEEAERAEEDNLTEQDAEAKCGMEDSPQTSSQQHVKEEKHKDEASCSTPKVNPIKINLKMLKVTESSGAEPESAQAAKVESQTTPPPSTSSSDGKNLPDPFHLLKQFFVRARWPNSAQHDDLSARSGLPRAEVVRWFGDARYSHKNGQLKWLESYQQMAEERKDREKAESTVLKDHLSLHGKLEEEHVKGLVELSGLSEEQVRRWFATQGPSLLESEVAATAEPVLQDQRAVKEQQNKATADAAVLINDTALATNSQSVNPKQGTD